MGTVHHIKTDEKLKELLTVLEANPENFLGALDKVTPGWRISQSAGNRYGGSEHHWIVVFSRALHDTLPMPYNALLYDLDQQHGFMAVQAYGLTKPSLDVIRDWIDAAIAYNDAIYRNK